VPKVSLGLPVYNGEQYLEQALDSVLAQTMTDFELIISDNASTDATPDICARYARGDSRISFVRNERNLGAAPNYNRTFELASGEFFKWQTHDDRIGETYLERCVEELENDPHVVMSYPRIIYIDEENDVIGRQDEKDLSIRSRDPASRVGQLITHELSGTDIFFAGIFALMRREVLATTPLHGSYNAADQVLVFQMLLHGDFAQVDDYLYYRRDHPMASMVANTAPRDVLTWFNVDAKRTIILPHWKLLYEHLASVNRMKFDPRTRVRIHYHLARRFGKEWRNFPGDLKLALKDLEQDRRRRRRARSSARS
jgi:glycosyltransferase involved in cell wall biosynthesis